MCRGAGRSCNWSAKPVTAHGSHPRTQAPPARTTSSAQSASPPARWPSGPVTIHACRRRVGCEAQSVDALTLSSGRCQPPPSAPPSPSCPSPACGSRRRCPSRSSSGSIDQVARSLGRDMKMPGFRAGKIPSKVVVQRLGREVVLDEAIRATIGRWYLDAVETSGIHPVGDPDLDARRPGRRGRAVELQLRDRRAAGRDARDVQGPGGAAARAAGRRGRPSPPRSTSCASG